VAFCGEVEIGDSVRYQQRHYIVRGFTRVSSDQQHAVLENAKPAGLSPCH
jgi:hypothetical protein